MPIVADVHNNHRMALAQRSERGVTACACNPGNIKPRAHQADRPGGQGPRRAHHASASTAGPSTSSSTKHGGQVTPEAMVESAQMELAAYFDEVGFDQVKISVKASSVPRP
ncbi:MAG: flavodoxin-dependent (E)-4-hydroxy-3-methylbut-2-enyl-diphosphate synthase [Acidimicrobiales bacterium]